MGHEIFYITCLPCIHWNLDPFLCRRLVNMWTVGHSWREGKCVCVGVSVCVWVSARTPEIQVFGLLGPQSHLSSPPFLHLSTPFHPPPSSSDLSMTPPCPSICPQASGRPGPTRPGPPTETEATHEDTSVEEACQSLPLDVYLEMLKHGATRGPENMSTVIPAVVPLTLLKTQTGTDPIYPPLFPTLCSDLPVLVPFVS